MSRHRSYQRTDRLGRQLQEVLATVLLRETREEALHGVVVTAVEVTRDLSVATVYYYLMGVDDAAVQQALGRALGFLRKRVGEEIRMRRTPELRFVWDASIDRGRRVESALRELGLGEAARGEGEPGPDGAAPDEEPPEA